MKTNYLQLLTLLLFIFGIQSLHGQQKGTVTDIDGNVYQTVKIGDQWWMAENLRVTRYRNGDAIPTNLRNTQWQNTTSGAYAIYPHIQIRGLYSEDEVVDTYGILYNWYAVVDPRGLCPEGWHVPSEEGWKQLEMHLGMTQEEADRTAGRGATGGGKLKSTRTSIPACPHPRWRSPNTGATNESGFSGLPGGRRRFPQYGGGHYVSVGERGLWWSSTEHSTGSAWFRSLTYGHWYVYRFNGYKQDGLSVRCLR